jgi:DNA-binding MarR family transcriptional regulator
MAPDKSALAAETWGLFFELLMRTHGHRDKVMAKHGLTPNDMRALMTLNPAGGHTMRDLAERWGCDASNATFIVDRLEKRGLAERTAQPGDRRVKLVVLTSAGEKTRRKVRDAMWVPPPQILALPRPTLEALHDALAAAVEDSPDDPASPASHPARRTRSRR